MTKSPKKHKEPKDPRLAVWKKDVKGLKSKDAAVRCEALAKCKDLAFLEQGHALPVFMKMLTMAKKAQHGALMDAIAAFRAIIAPAAVDGALPEGAAETARAFAALVLREGLRSDTAWTGAGALVDLFEDKRADVSEAALGCFTDFANLAASLGSADGDGERAAELAAWRSSLCSAGNPVKHLAKFLHASQAKKPKPKRTPEHKLLVLRCLVALAGACPDNAVLAALVPSGALGMALSFVKKEPGSELASAAIHVLLCGSAAAAGRAAIAKAGVAKLFPQVDAEVTPAPPAAAEGADEGAEPAPEASAPAQQRAAQLLTRVLCLPLTDEEPEEAEKAAEARPGCWRHWLAASARRTATSTTLVKRLNARYKA